MGGEYQCLALLAHPMNGEKHFFASVIEAAQSSDRNKILKRNFPTENESQSSGWDATRRFPDFDRTGARRVRLLTFLLLWPNLFVTPLKQVLLFLFISRTVLNKLWTLCSASMLSSYPSPTLHSLGETFRGFEPNVLGTVWIGTSDCFPNTSDLQSLSLAAIFN